MIEKFPQRKNKPTHKDQESMNKDIVLETEATLRETGEALNELKKILEDAKNEVDE